MRFYSLFSFLFIIGFSSIQANNIQVSNVGYTGSPGEYEYEITFDLSWENSWRTSTYESNYDAAWVFIKYRGGQYPEWTHALLDGNNGPTPSGAELIASPDQLGYFIQRSSDGIGDVNYEGFHLAWQLDDFFLPDDKVEICVYAIEMVYIPQGPFQVGDGSSSISTFQAGDSGTPLTITSEGSLTLGGGNIANLGYSGTLIDDFSTTITQVLPATYPKGYQEFYIMKYEMSQGQYASFLNSIPLAEQSSRIDMTNLGQVITYGLDGQSIKNIGGPRYFQADAPNRAANYLNWGDLAMYADWSGLRPMSELEFEKACRGPVAAIPNEYAWGSNTIFFDVYNFGTNDDGFEIVLNPAAELGNALIKTFGQSLTSPSNCGVFSASTSDSGRKAVGGTYYGVLEMSGNVRELVISLENPQGRAFNGDIHGDGYVSSTIILWPAVSGIDMDIGTSYRGGAFNAYPNFSVVSARIPGATEAYPRSNSVGGRLVRSNF